MPNSATIRLVPGLVWCPTRAGAPPLDGRLVRLLAAIKEHATLRAAAGHAGLSYRAAWGLLGETGRLLGVPLVELQRGRGARLTGAGEQFLAANERAVERLRDGSFAVELTVRKPSARRRPLAQLALAASHDLLLAAFYDRWAKPEGVVGAIAFQGSTESLKALARSEVDIAGFHAVAPMENGLAAGFRRLLDPRRDVLIRFAEREQGLMVPKGNPRGLRSLADVARERVQFVNRQRGSGTRLLVDQLLKQARISPASVRGYETEEYTHLAVAATIAAGQADAGFGLKAAAGRLGLDFVPLLKEIYWLAVRSRRLESASMQSLLRALQGDPLRNALRGLSGYSIQDAGAIVPLRDVFR